MLPAAGQAILVASEERDEPSSTCLTVGNGGSSLFLVGYKQNLKGLEEHCDSINLGHVPVYRGIELSADDLLRRKVGRISWLDRLVLSVSDF